MNRRKRSWTFIVLLIPVICGSNLQKLNYSFTTPEAAFLVYWCKNAALEERIAAWREIIDTMPTALWRSG